ncbi:MAG: WYL domain-containing protein [Actinomycetota bacterium]
MNRTDRLHAIHEALRRAGPAGTTASRLADDLEVSMRTIKRDVSALQQAGAPIWAQPGPGGGYRLDGSATLPPVAFTPSQAVAAAVALATLPAGSPFGVDARAAADKLLDTLDEPARARAERMSERVWVLDQDPERPFDRSIVRAIERSLSERLAVTIGYTTERETTERTVEPIILAWSGRRWWLVGHCRLRDDIRWFRFDRITRAACTGTSYRPRPVADVGEPPAAARPVTR